MTDDKKLPTRNPPKKQTDLLSDILLNKTIYTPLADVKRLKVPTHGKVKLLILGISERIDFTKTPIIVLGRKDTTKNTGHVYDLSAYGAAERGVSRVHCQLEVKDDQILITDLDSTNGTYLRRKRLKPNQSYVMQKGDKLMLGRLPIQIMTK